MITSAALAWIPGLPLLGSAAILGLMIAARGSGGRVAPMLATGFAFASFIAVLYMWWLGFQTAADRIQVTQTLFAWFHVGQWRASMGFYLDSVSLVMVTLISGVGSLIHLYSTAFMASDPCRGRYFFFLNLFLASMLILVLADNLVLLYLAWEAVGLCSFALIGFWYHDPAKAAAGRKAFTVTRIGDTAFAVAVFMIFSAFGELNFQALFAAVPAVFQESLVAGGWQGWYFFVVCLLLLIGAMGKSAQVPLHVWLPDAMAGPSPVSALIHAATMVTAGVYLIIRLHPFFELAPLAKGAVAVTGAVTLFYGASCALGQHDFKRVLAYSTISQIGYMFLALGCGAYAFALLHLITHGFFKALLFLSAGSVIKACHEAHDIRRMGGLVGKLPLVHGAFLAGSLALAAVPLVGAGFFSKDAILAAVWPAPGGGWLWLVAMTGAFITGLYIFRTYLLVFHGDYQGQRQPDVAAVSAWNMTIPLLVLAVFSIGAGWVEFPQGWFGPHAWQTWFVPVFPAVVHPHGGIAYVLQAASVIVVLLAMAAAWYWVRRERQGKMPALTFLTHGWEFDRLYALVFVSGYRRLAGAGALVEKTVIDGGVRVLQWAMLTTARVCQRVVEHWILGGAARSLVNGLRMAHGVLIATQNGYLPRYLLLTVIGAVFLLAYWMGG